MSASNTTSTISVPSPVSKLLLLVPADGLLEVLRDLFKFGSLISILDRFDLPDFDAATIESASIPVSVCVAVALRSAIRSFTSPPNAWNTGMHSAKSLESMSFRSTASSPQWSGHLIVERERQKRRDALPWPCILRLAQLSR